MYTFYPREEEEEEEEEKEDRIRARKRSKTHWLKVKLEDDQLYSSRVIRCVNLIIDAKKNHPGEKIVGFSNYPRFLQMVKEALFPRPPETNTSLMSLVRSLYVTEVDLECQYTDIIAESRNSG